MFKNKSKWAGAALALVMVLVFTTPIFAEGEMGPAEPPGVVEETSSFFDHPIVKWIANFFFNPIEVEGEDPGLEEGGGSPEGTPDPEPTPEPTLIPVIVPEEAVAAMHVDGDLGFGEIVKLLEIVENAQAACVDNQENCEVTLESLLDEYKDGTGMGELFEIYGKPENLGVGHIREEKEKTNNGKAKGKNK